MVFLLCVPSWLHFDLDLACKHWFRCHQMMFDINVSLWNSNLKMSLCFCCFDVSVCVQPWELGSHGSPRRLSNPQSPLFLWADGDLSSILDDVQQSSGEQVSQPLEQWLLGTQPTSPQPQFKRGPLPRNERSGQIHHFWLWRWRIYRRRWGRSWWGWSTAQTIGFAKTRTRGERLAQLWIIKLPQPALQPLRTVSRECPTVFPLQSELIPKELPEESEFCWLYWYISRHLH